MKRDDHVGARLIAPDKRRRHNGDMENNIVISNAYAGAVRPDGKLAHKTGANLCIFGHVLAVFVSTAPVDGHIFFLLASADGGPMPAVLNDRSAVRIQLDGVVDDRINLLIFKIDPTSAKAG
jgi:hypothetical protein